MPSTTQTVTINADIESVWARISDFHDFSWATEIISSCEKMGDRTGTEVGAKRLLNGVFHETLTVRQADRYLLKYSIDDGPPPVSRNDVSDYTGTIQLSVQDAGSATRVDWSSEWQSDTQDAVEFCHGIYTALLEALAASFK